METEPDMKKIPLSVIELHVVPMGAPRQTRRDRWAERPVIKRYHAFRDIVRLGLNKAGDTVRPGADITFDVPMPKSWSKKKRKEMNGRPHKQTPDLDNFIKALLDAAFGEDKHIWWLGHTVKRWAETGKIIISNHEN